MPVDGYLMEDPREADRLARKVDADAWVGHYLAPHLAASSAILDVGCGPATLASAAARACPTAIVTALDASATRAEVAHRTLASHPNASFVLGTIHDLPFPDDTFDLVYSRFLLEYVPRKAQAVAELARVCRPGGTILLQDLDGQLVNRYPPDPELDADVDVALDLLAATGFDPYIGRKLQHLAISAGFTDITVEAETYHLIVGAIGERERDLWATKLAIAATTLTAHGYPDAETLTTRFLDYLDREDTLVFSSCSRSPRRKLPEDFSLTAPFSSARPLDRSDPDTLGSFCTEHGTRVGRGRLRRPYAEAARPRAESQWRRRTKAPPAR